MDKQTEQKIQKQIIVYYKCLRTHSEKWKNICTNDILPIIQALINQIEQLIAAKKFDIKDTELVTFPNLKDRLCYKIYTGIENEILSLEKPLSELNLSSQDLKTKTSQLELMTLQLDWSSDSTSSIVKGLLLQRPLGEILEWSYRIVTYYKNLMADIYAKFKNIDYSNIETIHEFKKCFQFDSEMEILISHALNYLQFCEKVEIT